MRELCLAFLIAVVVVGGIGASKAQPQGNEQAIRQAEADFEAARAAKGLEGWLSFFADDATDLAAGAPIADKTAMRARLQLTLTEGSYGMVVALLTATATAAVLFIGVRRIEAGTLTLGNFLLVMGYLAQLAAPLGFHDELQRFAIAFGSGRETDAHNMHADVG